MDREELINSQLEGVNAAILIDDVIGGDGSEIYVEFKGRSSRFKINEELGYSINKWIKELPKIATFEIEEIMKKYDVTLKEIAELLEDEELMVIDNIEEWVKTYNKQDAFLPIETIDKMIEGNE